MTFTLGELVILVCCFWFNVPSKIKLVAPLFCAKDHTRYTDWVFVF